MIKLLKNKEVRKALLWQLLYCGPLARLIFRLLFARQLKKDAEQAAVEAAPVQE